MAKDKLTDYDSTAANNLDVGGISVAEGMLPSGVNNAIREQMSHLADFAAGTSGVDVLKLQDDTDTNSIKLQAPASVTATTTFTLPDGDGASGQTMITDGAGALSWAAPYGNRNLIINGSQTVAQRGTSATGQTSVDGYPCVDRFRIQADSSGTFTFSQSTTAPDGFANSFKVECTTADASPNYLLIFQRMEGQNLQQLKKGTANAESLTLSFWVRSSKTGTYQANLRDHDNGRLIGQSYTISSANTWEYKTLTFAGDTTGTLDNDSSNSFAVEWWLAAGATYSGGAVPTAWETLDNTDRAAALTGAIGASTSDDFYITGVQLELGETATPFEHRSFGDELARCHRYYYAIDQNTVGSIYTAFIGTGYSSTQCNFQVSFPVQMRASPTMSYNSGTGYYRFYRAGTYDPFDVLQNDATSPLHANIASNGGVSHTAGDCGTVQVRVGDGAGFQANAEL